MGLGKSPFLSALCLVEALADVVPDGWDADGRPVGKPWSMVRTPLVQVAAVTEDQVRTNTWGSMLEMVDPELDPPVFDYYRGLEPMDTFVNLPKGRIQMVTASASSVKGARAVFSVWDQTEEWTTSNGGKRLAAVMADNAAKVGGSYVETPNAFTPGLSSVAEESATEWAAMKEGRTRGDKSLLYDHREAPADTDLTDRESLLAGLRFAYGDSSAHPDGCVIHDPPCSPGWADHDAHIARAWSLSGGNTEQNFRANFLGQITHASDAWVSQIEWAACADASKVLKPGDAIALGFDGSLGRAKGKPDATALIGVRVSDGFVFEVGIWEASEDKSTWEDWSPPLVEIEAALADCFKTYKVVAFYADPAAGWSGHLATWAARWSAKVPVKARRDKPFTWNMSHQTNVQVAIENVEQAIFNQELSHDGGGLALTRHVLNARRRFRNKKLALGKASDYSTHKIDAAVAMVLAWQGCLDARSAGHGQAREKVRGIRVR